MVKPNSGYARVMRWNPPRHCEEQSGRNNPIFSAGKMDCFASLAMTGPHKTQQVAAHYSGNIVVAKDLMRF